MVSPPDHPSRREHTAAGIPCSPLREAPAPSKQQRALLTAWSSSSSGSSSGGSLRPRSLYASSRRGRVTLPAAVAVLACALAGPLGALAQEEEAAADDGGGGVGALILNLVGVVFLVAASGLFSGLTLGLLGLDKIGLEIISHGDEPRMAAFAKVGRARDGPICRHLRSVIRIEHANLTYNPLDFTIFESRVSSRRSAASRRGT